MDEWTTLFDHQQVWRVDSFGVQKALMVTLKFNKLLNMRLYKYVLILTLYLAPSGLFGQVNGYAKVTAISGTTLTLSNADETFDGFVVGEQVVIMQMQDNVIGDVSNSASFGDLGAISSVGLYELVEIAAVSASPVTSITLVNPPTNTYNTCTTCSVQLITFPTLGGGGDFTTTTDITALDWDGNVGGVVAFEVTGVLNLAHNVNADGAGFRGGAMNRGRSTGCSGNSNYRVVTQANHADKGEGIYNVDLATNANYAAGMGKILNGGGGGNSHNAGGGGGGNYTGGGQGGPGWPTCNPSAGGLGGLDLSGNISVDRIFMGGGGGSGEGNNNAAGAGANGGGIVLIRAHEISTSGSCGGRSISANGDDALDSPANDGAGGGGAGGSIVLEVDAYNIAAGCNLTVASSGGDGGGVNSGATHGGGGGGGQGVVFYSIAQPTTNITTTTNNGSGGCNNNSNPCTTIANTGTGPNDSGIIDDVTGPLPIVLAYFKGESEMNRSRLYWKTLSEINNDFFTIERSPAPTAEGFNWEIVATMPGAGNSVEPLDYQFFDEDPLFGRNFYRLKQTDFDGKYAYSDIILIESEFSFALFPNPTRGDVTLVLDEAAGFDKIQTKLFNSIGQQVPITLIKPGGSRIHITTTNLPAGVYWLNVNYQGFEDTKKLVIVD